MQNILNNNICNFEILNKYSLIESGYTKPLNVLSSTFFKREQYYKNFGIYVKGLKKVIEFMDKKKNVAEGDEYYFVLFIDQNIRDDDTLMGLINDCPSIIPILFKCSEYMTGNYHNDLFGTLIRFFPMFNFENNPFGIVICIDLDLHDEDYVRLESVMKHKPKGITVSADFARLIYKKEPAYAYAHLVCYNMDKFENRLITDFIKNAHKIKSTGNYGKRLTTFGFGIDEIFLNQTFLEAIVKYRVIIDYQISYFLFHSKERIIKTSKIDATNNILTIILGKHSDQKMNVEDKLSFIDKNTYGIRYATEINDEISRRFYLTICHLVHINKNWLEGDVQKFICTYLKNVISANLVIDTNRKSDIISADVYDAVVDSDFIPPGYIEEKVTNDEE
jgi:hypothetical protein